MTQRGPERSKTMHQGDNISIGALTTNSPILNKFLGLHGLTVLFKKEEVTLRLTGIIKHCKMVQIGKKCFFNISQAISTMVLDHQCRALNVTDGGKSKRSYASYLFCSM